MYHIWKHNHINSSQGKLRCGRAMARYGLSGDMELRRAARLSTWLVQLQEKYATSGPGGGPKFGATFKVYGQSGR
jgi:hypothetical protein